VERGKTHLQEKSGAGSSDEQVCYYLSALASNSTVWWARKSERIVLAKWKCRWKREGGSVLRCVWVALWLCCATMWVLVGKWQWIWRKKKVRGMSWA